MKAAGRIVLAGMVGTTFMTAYSYWLSKKERQEFTEPVLLNKLSNSSSKLPDVDDVATHPAGWAAHYLTGIAFVITYYILCRRALHSPGIVKGLLVGGASGVLAIASWKMMFAASPNPPQNDRDAYYRQLFIAHLIFSVFALYGYKLPDYIKRISLKK
ncbi:MAG: hypothetical protein ACO1N9_12145 [Flavobacterium sp.]